jgi:sortase A
VAAAISPHPGILTATHEGRDQKASLIPVLRWTQRALFAGAMVTLGYCAFVMVDRATFQHREKQRLQNLLNVRHQAGNAPQTAAKPVVQLVASAGSDGLIGRIEIVRLGISIMVVEGTSKRTLRRAAGHIQGTALPGQRGNVGISAHRDTFFRPLRNIQPGDVVTLTTTEGEYHYRVVSTKVVTPSEVAVLYSDENEILTLVTCYPFYFVGAAPSRFIVRAEKIP